MDKLGKYDLLRERALANFELLLNKWQISYIKISEYEYDFLNPNRDDRNYGACRFNTQKGKGADFAGTNYAQGDFERVGIGFDRDDFAGIAASKEIINTNWGFDIIGLTQRFRKLYSYRDAAKVLERELLDLSTTESFIRTDHTAATKRIQNREAQARKNQSFAATVWDVAVPIDGTLAEQYLRNRSIELSGPLNNAGYLEYAKCTEINQYLPALVFRIEKEPGGELLATHRIFLSRDAKKADLIEPKKAIGPAKGGGIWFGKPGKILRVAEGPETALSVFTTFDDEFTVSTVFATNFGNLTIPSLVETVILMPDYDRAGAVNATKAAHNYAKQGKRVEIVYPPDGYKDWNDVIRGTDE